MSYEPLHHKYRPQTFKDLVGQEAISTTLTNAILNQKIAPAYLFTGPRGTGKTSSARIFAKSLNCLSTKIPTPEPCGQCEICRAIAKGSALDVIEIDAASNTGVDNIRELIERAQFAPVQCRYKVYTIDECLTADTKILTNEGTIPISNPNIEGKKVLSYNESSQTWEYKKVLRWLQKGIRKTLIIKTTNHQISCTDNHLIRTENGWIQAKNIVAGMKILSPVAVGKIINIYNTNLEKIESVNQGEIEAVYDLEVEDNHNFVANELLVHNCHMLSSAAFNALLKTLEEPPERVVFILATTDPQRVLPTIISRTQRFDYRRIPLQASIKHLQYIADREQITITPDAITLVAQIANGGLRDAESLLDQLSLLPNGITVEKVWDLVGAVPERDLLELLAGIENNNPEQILDKCRYLIDRGKEPLIILQNLASFYLNLLIAKTAPSRYDLVALSAPTWENLQARAINWSVDRIIQGQEQLKNAEVQLKNTTQPCLWLEIILINLLSSTKTITAPPTKEEAIPLTQTQEIKPTTPTRPQIEVKEIENDINKNQQPETTLIQTVKIPEAIAETQKTLSEPVANFDLKEIWKKVLDKVQPLTKALLIQHCFPISFDGNCAKIGISSPQLLKLNQNKLPSIQSAFIEVCQRQIKVTLEVADPDSIDESFSQSSSTATFSREIKSETPKKFEVLERDRPQELREEKLDKNHEHSLLAIPLEPLSLDRNEEIVVSRERQEEIYSYEDFHKAAEQLAKFFKGEVIK